MSNLYLPPENIREPLQDVRSFSILSNALLLVFNIPLQVYFFCVLPPTVTSVSQIFLAVVNDVESICELGIDLP